MSYRPLPQVLTEEELRRLIRSRVHYRSIWTKVKYDTLYMLLAATGLRRAEACQLRIGDINFLDNTLIVLHGKGDRSRIVPLPEEFIPHLKHYVGHRPGSDPLFPGIHNEPLNSDTMAHDLRKRAKAAGIERRIHPHMFRHTYATALLRTEGTSLAHIQRLLGHANINTTTIYTHLITEDLEPTVAKLPYRNLLSDNLITKKPILIR